MRHTTSLSRRAAALLLAFLLLLPTAYAAAGEQKLQTTTQLADGLAYRTNQKKRRCRARAQAFLVTLPPTDRKQHTTPHAQAQQNRGKEGHQRISRTNCRQRIRPQTLPDNQRIRNIICLL